MMNKFGCELKEFLDFQNISIKEFASRIDTTPKNLIDILKGNIELSQNMIYNISFITDIPVSYIENVEKNYKLDKAIDNLLEEKNLTIRKYINLFNYKEFSKQYHFEFTDERDDYSIAKDILRYLRISNPKSLYIKDNSIFYKSNNQKVELLALWLERCYRIVKSQNVLEYKKENIEVLVKYIKDCASKDIFNKERLIEEFNKNGIYLAIENDLPGSKIRGAFRILGTVPAIYITKKHKRYADVYFALLHELAHCKSDYNRAKNGSIVSYMDQDERDDYELKADNTAYNWMVDDKLYQLLKSRYTDTDMNHHDVVKSFFVYRLAHDGIIKYSSNIYQKNNKLLEKK